VYGEQLCVLGTLQVPAPSHVPPGWKVAEFTQKKPLHCMPAPVWAHAPPWHAPVLPQGFAVGAHWLCGSIAPLPTVVQLPGDVPLQVLHRPHVPKLQQTPSRQWPVPHSRSALHSVPAPACGTQAVPTQ
jgi:hypothetical protein